MKTVKKILAHLLVICLLVTSITVPAHAGRVSQAYIDINLHHEMIELRFWHQFKQYVHIAVYESGPADPNYPDEPGERGALIGYIVRYHFANGEGDFPFQRYFHCPEGEDHTHWAISHHDMPYEPYTWPFFPNRFPRNPGDPPYESLGGLFETFISTLADLPEKPEEEEEYCEYCECEKEYEYEEKYNEEEYEENGTADNGDENGNGELDINGETDTNGSADSNGELGSEPGGNNGAVNGNGASEEESNATSSNSEEMSGALRTSFSRTGLFAGLFSGSNGTENGAVSNDGYSNGASIPENGNGTNGVSDNGSNGYTGGDDENGYENGAYDNGYENGDSNGYENGYNNENGYENGKIDEDDEEENGDKEYYEEEEEKYEPEEDWENRPIGNQVIFGESRTVRFPFNPFNNRRGGIMPFGEEQVRETMLIPCPDVPGYNILLWDGRVNRNAGRMCDDGYMLPPDWYSVLTNMHQNHNRIQIVVKPIGFPWRNIPPTCTRDEYGNYIANPGQNWEWSRGYKTVGRMYYIDGSMWLLGVQVRELTNWLYEWLRFFYFGHFNYDELEECLEIGDPINAVTGAYIFRYTDLKLHGQWPLIWERIYSSIDMTNTGLGQGFSHTYDFRLVEDRGIIYIQAPFGEVITFFRMWDDNGPDFYRSLVGSRFSLENPSGDRLTYEMTFEDGSVFIFYDGNLVRIKTRSDENRAGNTIVYLDYEDDMLVRVRNPHEQYFNIIWNGDNITSVVDSTGRRVFYNYSGNNLTSFTNADGHTSFYTYENGFMVSHSDFSGEVFLRNAYDYRGRVTWQRMYTAGGFAEMYIDYNDIGDYVTLDSRGVNVVTMFTGEVVEYHYDQDGLIKEIVESTGEIRRNRWSDRYLRPELNERHGQERREHLVFTEKGRPKVIEHQDGASFGITYTPCGSRITRIDFWDGSFEQFTYQGANLVSFRDRNGNVTNFTFNAHGLLTSSTNVGTGETTRFYYAGSFLRERVCPAEGRTLFEHNDKGMVTSITGPLGNRTEFVYTSGGKLVRVIEVGETPAENRYMTFTHTPNGFVTSETCFRGFTEYTFFGTNNLPIKRIDRENNVTEFTYTPFGSLASIIETVYCDHNEVGIVRTTRFEYDYRGRLIRTINQDGTYTQNVFCPLNRLIATIDAKGYETRFTHDVMGRVEAITDARNVTTRFIHDPDGRVIEEIRAEGTAFEARTQFGFDPVGNRISVTDANGHTSRFAYDAANRLIRQYQPKDGQIYRITSFTYAQGRLTQITDGEGNVTRFAHDLAGNVIREYDALNHFTTFNFDIWSRLTSTVSPEGVTTRFNHDENGNVIRIARLFNPDTGVYAETTFERDGLGRVIREIDPEDNHTYTSFFGTFGVCTVIFEDRLFTRNHFNSMGQMISHTDRAGNITQYFHDARGQLTRIIDAEGYETIFNFDPTMNHIETIRGGNGCPMITMEKHTIDPLGRISSTEDPLGITRFTHDLVGNVLSVTDRNNNTTEFRHDHSGLRTMIIDPKGYPTTFTFDLAARLTSVTDAGGLLTTFVLDPNGNVIEQIETDGVTTYRMFWQYDRDQRPVRQTDRNGNVVEATYDRLGRIISTQTLYVESYYVVRHEFWYNFNDDIIRHRDPRNGLSHFSYDFAGNVLTHINQMGNIQRYTLDANFNIVAIDNRDRRVTLYTYDRLNRLLSETKPLGETIEFVYDAFHNIREVRQLQDDGRRWGITHFEVGPLGNPISETSQLRAVTLFETDAMGNVTRHQDPDGNVNYFEFDARNMLSVARYAGHEPMHFYYDAMGNLVRTTEEIGVTQFEFDKWNRLIKVTDHNQNVVSYMYDPNGNIVRMIYPDGRVVDREFDHMNRMTSITVDDQTKVYRFDPGGLLLERIYPLPYDSNFPHIRRTMMSYNAAGEILYVREIDPRYGNVRQTDFTHTAAGLLFREARTGVDVELRLESVYYYYDRSGRLIGTRTIVGDVVTRETFEYDIAGNLTREVRGGVEITYTYNAQNQMIQRNKGGEITNFVYDNRGNLISKTTPTGTTTFEYDSRGRMVFGTNERGETSEYRYNAIGARVFNEQVRYNWNIGHQNAERFRSSWEDSDTIDIIFRENRNVWQRIWETNVAGTVVQNNMETMTKHYLPDYTSWAWRDIYVFEDGSFVQSFIYDDLTLRPVALIIERDYVHQTDRVFMIPENPGTNPGTDIAVNVTTKVWYMGSQILFSNLFGVTYDGEMIFHMIYDPWGVPLVDPRLDMNLHGLDNINNFQGYTYDVVLNIFFAQFRFYDPNLRRFLSQDPIKDGHNWYAAVNNNPIRYIDPWGLAAEVTVVVNGQTVRAVQRDGQIFIGLWASLTAIGHVPQIESWTPERAHFIFEEATVFMYFEAGQSVALVMGTSVFPRSIATGAVLSNMAGGFGIEVGYFERLMCALLGENLDLNILLPRTIVTRAEWGGQNHNWTRQSGQHTIIVHHTYSGPNTTIQDIDRWHRNRGWAFGVGYHYVIKPGGAIYQGRPEYAVGVHAAGRNTGSIGIALVGTFHIAGSNPSQAQLDSLTWLIHDIRRRIPTIASVEAHHEQCPGPWFNDFVRSI